MKTINIFGKSIPVLAILMIGLAATGAAATIAYFGTVEGEVSVQEQALQVEQVSEEYTGDAAPETFYNLAEIKNNNEDIQVKYKWKIKENDNFDNHDNALREVYRIQNYNLDSDSSGYYVDVVPNIDEVTYIIHVEEEWFDRSVANADLQISPTASDNETNYHIKFSSDQHKEDHQDTEDGTNFEDTTNWAFYKPSVDKTTKRIGKENVLEQTEVRELEYNETAIRITVKREVNQPQSFGTAVHQAHEYSSGSWNSANTENFSYDNENQEDNHIQIDTTNYLDKEETIKRDGKALYNVGAFLDTDTDPSGTYNLEIGVEPVTMR